MKFRTLTAEEIDVRVGTCSEKGCSLLLFKNARADMTLLDETVGVMNWERKHEIIGGNLYCTVSIYDTEKCAWISKQDVGTESSAEKEKGQASDSFKRACFNFGIGRELYTAPFIWVQTGGVKLKEQNGKYKTYDKFRVKSIGYTDGKITELTIINESMGNRVVFSMGETITVAETITAAEQEVLKGLCKQAGLKVADTFPNGLELTPEQYTATVTKLNSIIEGKKK